MNPKKHEILGINESVNNFNDYRQQLDQETGLIRYGLETEDIYVESANHPKSLIATSFRGNDSTIIAVSNEIVHAVEESSPFNDKLFATMPYHLIDKCVDTSNLVFRDRLRLAESTAIKIFNGDYTFKTDINTDIEKYVGYSKRHYAGETYNEYMFMSKYDLSSTHQKYSKPADDFETPNGFIISTRPEEIKRYAEEIINLQDDVFSAQAIKTGYFAGLGNEEMLDILQNPEFIPIIARDKNTNEIAMCTLFAPDFTSFDSVPWLNPRDVAKHLCDGAVPDCLTLPLVVISKNSGLGLLKHAVQTALHETVYRHKPNIVAVMYESNPMSVYVTPRVIHQQIERAGGVCLSKHAEVYFFSQTSE